MTWGLCDSTTQDLREESLRWPERESSLLTTYWSESTSSSSWFAGPASRLGSLNFLFQAALYLPSCTFLCIGQPLSIDAEYDWYSPPFEVRLVFSPLRISGGNRGWNPSQWTRFVTESFRWTLNRRYQWLLSGDTKTTKRRANDTQSIKQRLYARDTKQGSVTDGFAGGSASPQGASKSLFVIALICSTRRQIPTSNSTNQGPEYGDLILL